jgi:hypothetical protein
MPDIDNFKKCCLTQAHLDMDSLDEDLFEPLQRFLEWWDRQNAAMQGIIEVLSRSNVTKSAFAKFLENLFLINLETAANLASVLIRAVVSASSLFEAIRVMTLCMFDEEICTNNGAGVCNKVTRLQRCSYKCKDGHEFNIDVNCPKKATSVPCPHGVRRR